MSQIQSKLKSNGSYRCPHLGLQQTPQHPGQRKACCGGVKSPEDTLVPVCTLINGLCPGLVNCPRLDLKTKSELIQQWRQDLQLNKSVDLASLLR